MNIFALGEDEPRLPPKDRYWVSKNAVVIGKVDVGLDVSIWNGAVIRGDNELIIIRNGSNIQENCVLHTDMGYPLEVGYDCTVGHGAILHGCRLGSRTIVGMGATLLNGACVGEDCIIGAGSLITEGKEFLDSGKLILGSPAKVVRDLSKEEVDKIAATALSYQAKIEVLAKQLRLVNED